MGDLRPGCPDDVMLEAYLYQDLPYLQKARVRVHLALCKRCQKRLHDLEHFSETLSKIPPEEPPAGFLDDILTSMDEWGDPTPVPAAEEDDQVPVHGPSVRVRWALGTVFFLVSSFIQWQYGEYLPRYLSGSYLTGLRGLGQVWEFFRSGGWWQTTVHVFEAVRTDGLGALEILGTSIPTQIAGVLVFGGIVTAVFVSQFRASRGKREGHRK